MPIVVDLDVEMARRTTGAGELCWRVGITPADLAVLRNGRARAVRSTLEALCAAPGCQPGDLLRYASEDHDPPAAAASTAAARGDRA